MWTSLLRAGSVTLLAALTIVLVAVDAGADFLILKNGQTYRGTLTEYPDGSVSSTDFGYRIRKDRVARSSREETVEEVIEAWSGEVGAGVSGPARESCLSLAKFCVFQKRYKEAGRFFALWGKRLKWKVYSSKYYFILSDAKAKRVKEVRDRLDAIMRFYQKEFGAKRELRQDFVVRFFRSENQFDAFCRESDMEGAGAFYDPELRELVLWDMSLTNKKFTFEAIYHEACHQYVSDYYLVHQPAHAWFSEGLATYYETAKCKGGRIVDHGKKQLDYVATLREAIRTGSLTPLTQFLPMERNSFYRSNESENYAQAWGLVYFFRNTKDKKSRKFLERYIDVLKETKDDAKALSEALEEAGYDELERAFKAFEKQF